MATVLKRFMTSIVWLLPLSIRLTDVFVDTSRRSSTLIALKTIIDGDTVQVSNEQLWEQKVETNDQMF